MPEFNIGIWGTSRAGKTTYLAMLYHELLRNNDRWDVFAREKEGRIFVENAFRHIFTHETFPEKTVESRRHIYHIDDRFHGHRFQLEFLDVPGELVEAYHDRSRRRHRVVVEQRETEPQTADRTPQELFEYFARCDGILVFIDPGWGARQNDHSPYDQLLFQFFQDLKEFRMDNPRGNQPDISPKIALCLVKIDGDDNLWQYRHLNGAEHCRRDPDGPNDWCDAHCPLVQYLGPQFMYKQLSGLIRPPENVRCFVMSSIGRYNDKPNISMVHPWSRPLSPKPPAFQGVRNPNLQKDITDRSVLQSFEPQSINSKDRIAPLNMLAPLEWMFSTNGTS